LFAELQVIQGAMLRGSDNTKKLQGIQIRHREHSANPLKGPLALKLVFLIENHIYLELEELK
jgi:hypothetical protein